MVVIIRARADLIKVAVLFSALFLLFTLLPSLDVAAQEGEEPLPNVYMYSNQTDPTNQRYSGRFIDFIYRPGEDTIADYEITVGKTTRPIFNTITVAGLNGAPIGILGPEYVSGEEQSDLIYHSRYLWLGNQSGLIIHDTPLWFMEAVSFDRPASIEMTMPAGFTATQLTSDTPNVEAWLLSDGNTQAFIAVGNGTLETDLLATDGTGDGSGSSEEGSISVSLQPEGALVFRVMAVDGFDRSDVLAIRDGLLNGTIVSELTLVQGQADTVLWEANNYLDWSTNVVNYSSSEILLSVEQETERNGVEGANTRAAPTDAAKVVLLDVDSNVLSNDTLDNLMVTANGEELSEAGSAQEVMDGGTGSFYALSGETSSKILICLPDGATNYTVAVNGG